MTSAVTRVTRFGRDLRTIPNLISLSRIGFIYGAAALFLTGHPFIALVSGTLAGITDYFDGWLARKWGQVTELGAILDRLCDLIFESTWLLLAVWFHVLSPVFFFVYLLRELVVLSARLYLGEQGVALPSSFLGKLKTNFLGYTAFLVYLAISDVIPVHGARQFLIVLAHVGLVSGLLLSYGSAYGYLRSFARAYNQRGT